MNNLACQLAEVKFSGSESDMSFSGYGAAFGNVDSYGDVIAQGAFKATLERARKTGNWPSMLSQHGGFLGSEMTPVGVWTSMEEDSKGLVVEGKFAPTPRGQELYSLMKMTPRPAINGLSIGYVAKEWSARSRPDEPRRTLKAVDLMEVSVVTMPANDKARVTSVKSISSIRELEEMLRNGTLPPLSANEAKAFLAGGFKALNVERDAGTGDDLVDLVRRNIQKLKG